MVKRENLLVIAGLFWLFAGVNVAGIGVRSFFSVEVGHGPGCSPSWRSCSSHSG